MIDSHVLITTEHRGVFFGRLREERDDGRTVVLTDARCAICWETTGGFLELASKGPNKNSHIGDIAREIVLYDVTSTTRVTSDAARAWNAHAS